MVTLQAHTLCPLFSGSSDTINIEYPVTFGGATITFGDAVTDIHILNGRMSTSTAAGAALAIGATYLYGEGVELRYQVTNWTGVGSSFKGMYLRAEAATNSAAGKSVYGQEIYGVCNNVTMTTGSLWGALFYAYNKGVGAVTINHMYAVQAELSWDASRTGDCTITTAAACVRAKITGGRCADYTKIHGYVLTIGEMDGDSQTFGNGILMQDDGDMSGTSTLTTGLNIVIGCTTGIAIAGACATGLTFTGSYTTAAIQCGTSAAKMTLAAADDHAIDVNTTCASTHASNSVRPIHMISTMTGAAGVGGRAEFEMTTNVELGGWCNALKAFMNFGANGGVTGLASAMNAELVMPSSLSGSGGTYACYEGNIVYPASGFTGGQPTSWFRLATSGADKTYFDTNGYLFDIIGVTAGAGKFFTTDDEPTPTHALRIRIGGTEYWISVSDSVTAD
jgi:hypothetical protein